ncbi:MAG: aminoacyl-histidine dipeptidase [Cryomorphaceae bacterium]|nr:aminoacyl-histidine dipeptidase [Cryomorphaceae bacterium]
MSVSQLSPQSVWTYFEQLNAIPRASKKEEKVLAWIKAFADAHGLTHKQDRVGNIVIYKPATAGKEGSPKVVMQGHVDMVHQKNADTDFDFDKEGIRMKIEGDWVKAEGTTLGADNGMAVATMMAILASDDIAHPALEALFTVDEEAGMTGAQHLAEDLLSGEILLNMDTEEDDEFTIGSAGGVDTTTNYYFDKEELGEGFSGYNIVLHGLQGGHSGMEIHLGLGNANILLAQLILEAAPNIRLAKFDGGSLRNAIPREASAIIALPESNAETLIAKIQKAFDAMKGIYAKTDPNMTLSIQPAMGITLAAEYNDTLSMLNSIAGCPNGVFRLSPEVPGLTETSSNLARVVINDGHFTTLSLQRSSIDVARDFAGKTVGASFAAIGAEVEHSGQYPGWQPKSDSKIVNLMKEAYEANFDASPRITICHAGLECGLIGKHYPELDMISYGPTIRGAHSPDERVSISSVEKFWKLTLDTLARL